MEAKLIAIEGIDGAGTTTQAVMLRDALIARGEPVVLTCEPTGGPVGSVIRLGLSGRLNLHPKDKDSNEEEALYALLFATDRLDHLLTEVEPALAGGHHVISDRYYLSSFAYQSTRCDLAWVRQLNAHCRRPTVTFLLDADPGICLERIGKGRHNRERYEKLEQLTLIRDNYLKIADVLRSEGERIVQIDAAKAAQAVHEEILAEVISLA